MSDIPRPTGNCPHCHMPALLLADGSMVIHQRRKQHRWIHCKGSGRTPLFHRLDFPRAPDPADPVPPAGMDRYVIGVDPGNSGGPMVVLNRVTGEIVYEKGPKR